MNKYTAVNKLSNQIVFSSDIDEMIVNDVDLNTLRHEATNYDKVWRKAYSLDTDANWVIRTLKNDVNNALLVKVQDYKNAEIAQLKALLAAQQTVKVVVQTLEEIAANDYVKADGTYHW